MKIIENNLRYSSCPLCKSDLITFQGQIKSANPTYYSTIEIQLSNYSELWQCEQCKSSFIQNAVPEEDAIKLYSQGSSEKRWTKLPFEKAKTNTVISKLTSLLKNGDKVLDIGCGSGSFLDFAKVRGCETYGVEYSYSSLENIVRNGHIGFSSLSEVNQVFDVITAFDVIEHLYDVPNFLEICTSKLSLNGYLVLLTGDIACNSSKAAESNWWYVQYPEHIVFPSKKIFMDYSGLEIADWITTYHAPSAHSNFLLNSMKGFLRVIQKKIYDGNPSFSADHYLVFLRKVVP
jgi:SAM-dependent methyltransferase